MLKIFRGATYMKKIQKVIFTQSHADVLNCIRNTRDKYITIRQILGQLSQPDSYERQVKSIVFDLIVEFNYPIGSSRQHGYFYCNKPEDKVEAVNTLKSFINGNVKRLEAFEKIEV